MPKLTDMRVRKAKPDDKDVRLADGGGLYLLVTQTGGKLWRYKYRFRQKEKLMALGKYPEISLSDARERHFQARKLLANDIDPMADRKAQKDAEQSSDAPSFEAVALLWHEHWKAGKSDQHADTIIRRLKRNVFPALGDRPITDIKTSEVVSMVKAVEARGVADLAKRALETAGQIFRYAIAHEYAEMNPAANIKPRDILRATPKKNIARIDPKELPALLRSIEVYRGTHITRLGAKLMAHTFLRTGEMIGGKWAEIDFGAARWNIPKERMKMKTPHIVPLSTQTLEILRLLEQISGQGKLVFPGDRDYSKPISNNTILFALGRMGYKYTMTGHGFRGLASTVLHEEGFEHEHIELQLAHMPRNAVSAAYNHALYLKQRAKMMQWWSDYLEKQQKHL